MQVVSNVTYEAAFVRKPQSKKVAIKMNSAEALTWLFKFNEMIRNVITFPLSHSRSSK